ncbi:hypothetical protein HYC85_026920 [Camellia sinensis]|uniref:Uncharacterized protein n=1 Tax=Camellia sinensis TaxID=4442 RepID=A0A7J7G782_CAMSI|nr:hypothetical protein HYC85_026920 [Camellia sinensis]
MTESVSRDIFILSIDFSTDSNPNAMLSLPEEIITDILSIASEAASSIQMCFYALACSN